MALIKCPECSNDVSDIAISCPKCGYPLKNASQTPNAKVDALIEQAILREGKIAAIKLYRDHNPKAGLADAKEYVERIIARMPPGSAPITTSKGCSSMIVVCGLVLVGAMALLFVLCY